MTLFDLTGQVCLVTGSSMGIGRAAVERMAEHGARVVVTSREAERAEAVAADLNNRYGAGVAIGAAFVLERVGDGPRLVDQTLQAFGRIDTVVANAVFLTFGRLDDIEDEALTSTLNANVGNYAALARAAAAPMKAQGGGSIIFILSSLGFFASPPYLAYSVAKAALSHMTKVLAVDYGRQNIRVNAIAPGSIRTSSNFHDNAEQSRVLIGRIPLQRPGIADEIAAGIVFLASPGGAYVTGQSLIIDGGQVLQGMEGAREAYENLTVARDKAAAERAGK